MRKINVLTFLTLDGVMQGPGGSTEDTDGNFTYGGWVGPYFDEFLGQTMGEQMQPSDLLLGRRTFEIFASYWPQHADEWPGINDVTKYVASNTLTSSDWQNTTILRGNVVDQIKQIKSGEGRDLQVHGSANFIQTLLKADLIDEFWFKIFPITIGTGKRLFDQGTMPASFTLTEAKSSPSGVIVANYKRAGEFHTADVFA